MPRRAGRGLARHPYSWNPAGSCTDQVSIQRVLPLTYSPTLTLPQPEFLWSSVSGSTRPIGARHQGSLLRKSKC